MVKEKMKGEWDKKIEGNKKRVTGRQVHISRKGERKKDRNMNIKEWNQADGIGETKTNNLHNRKNFVPEKKQNKSKMG